MASRAPIIPLWMVDYPFVRDEPASASSELQRETAEECLPLLLKGSVSSLLPKLEKRKHAAFLRSKVGRLPAPYAALDAGRPWILYWCINGLALLDEDVTQFQESVVNTLRPLQNKEGGFGGGQGQFSHLAATYAAVLALVLVGGTDAFELVDRHAMWEWLGRLKQPGGEFAICEGGECDTRAAYCACVMISIFNLPLALPIHSPARLSGCEGLIDGLPEWLSRCQTYDGGIANAPGSESHGAYTFCALACLCILGSPHDTLSRYLDLYALTGWLAARQHAPEGGCAGRANKLVDGCYSHWIGGCWPLIEVAISGNESVSEKDLGHKRDLFHKEGLIRYIHCCCQAPKGGLRDKPEMVPDAYHSCYNLAGLSSMQNVYSIDSSRPTQKIGLHSGFSWIASAQHPGYPTESPRFSRLFSNNDRLTLLNPVYVIPQDALMTAYEYFSSRPLKPFE